MDETDPRLRVYVYRMIGNRKIKPSLYAGPPFGTLEEYIRDEFGGGMFYIMIRRGETMELAGTIAILLPLNHPRNRQDRSNQASV